MGKGEGGLFVRFRLVYIPILRLRWLVGGGGGWWWWLVVVGWWLVCKPILLFSLSLDQAEQSYFPCSFGYESDHPKLIKGCTFVLKCLTSSHIFTILVQIKIITPIVSLTRVLQICKLDKED